MNILTDLTELVSAVFEKHGYGPSYGGVTVSNRPDLCHFQCNGALPAAKVFKKNPLAIAAEVADDLINDARFASAEAVPPGFINLRLSDTFLTSLLQGMAEDERLLLPLMNPKTIVADYGGPNVAKPLHVGHLRSAIIGDSVTRLSRFLGHTVVSDTHLGDWGLQMGLIIAEMEERGLAAADVTLDDLNEIYPAASARSKAEPDFAAKAAARTAALQGGDPALRAVWEAVRSTSVNDLRKSYEALGVSFDLWKGESDAEPFIPLTLGSLRDKGLLRESEGALVVDVALPEDKEPMPPMIVQKSNGADLYGTTDLATLLQRKRDFNPDEVWYFTDNRQSLHFKQVFRCAKLTGFLSENGKEMTCHHYPFGTVNGKDGKPFKTRDGGVMQLSGLIDMVVSNAFEKASSSEIGINEAELGMIARQLGMAALRVGDMQNHRSKDYVFDMDRFLASEGKTGPYLLYTAVRIRSVLAKAGEAPGGTLLPPATDTERDLMLILTMVSDALLRAYADKAPSAICDILFELAGRFNRFYFEHKILSHPDRNRRASWLSLLALTDRFLATLLGLLGVEIPKHM